MNRLMQMLLNKRFNKVEGDGTDAGGGAADDFDTSWLLGEDEEEEEKEVEVEDGEGEVDNTEAEVSVGEGEEKKVEETKVEETKTPEPEVKEPEVLPTDEERQAQHQAYLAEVEKVFAISEDDANLLLTEPEKVIPKLGAQIHDYTMREVAKMQQMMLQELPKYMENLMAQKNEAASHENMFMEANAHLASVDKNELRELINEYGPLLVKKMAGKTPQEKLVALGDVISTVKGIPRVAPVAKKEESKPPKARPFTPVAPAQSGGNPGRPAPATQEEAFIEMLLNSDE